MKQSAESKPYPPYPNMSGTFINCPDNASAGKEGGNRTHIKLMTMTNKIKTKPNRGAEEEKGEKIWNNNNQQSFRNMNVVSLFFEIKV